MGESKAKFLLLSQKASALDLDAVIARLVEKGDYKAEKAKRAADEYRKFLVLMGMGKTPLASKDGPRCLAGPRHAASPENRVTFPW